MCAFDCMFWLVCKADVVDFYTQIQWTDPQFCIKKITNGNMLSIEWSLKKQIYQFLKLGMKKKITKGNMLSIKWSLKKQIYHFLKLGMNYFL